MKHGKPTLIIFSSIFALLSLNLLGCSTSSCHDVQSVGVLDSDHPLNITNPSSLASNAKAFGIATLRVPENYSLAIRFSDQLDILTTDPNRVHQVLLLPVDQLVYWRIDPINSDDYQYGMSQFDLSKTQVKNLSMWGGFGVTGESERRFSNQHFVPFRYFNYGDNVPQSEELTVGFVRNSVSD